MPQVLDSNGMPIDTLIIPNIPLFEFAGTGIKYDLLNGLRVLFPQAESLSDDRSWHITVADRDTGTIICDADVKPENLVVTSKKYYVPFDVCIKDADGQAIVRQSLDIKDKPVLLYMAVSTIGDTFAWFPYAEQFAEKHGCNVHVVLNPKFIQLLEKQYPAISLITPDQAQSMLESDKPPFACYFVGLWWGNERNYQPCDHRLVGLQKTAAYILGLEPEEIKPRFDLSAPRQIKEPYVCIAAQSTTHSKNWSNATGWLDVVQFLKECGYRVLCVDRDKVQGVGNVLNYIPYGAEDFTGNHPLQERIDLIKNADFFIGLASGLSWMSWACNVPTVLIGGFSHPITEFYTPFRVINYHACNSCWNDPQYDFDHADWLWCPRNAGTPKQHECMKMISSAQVIQTIKRIPAFKKHMEKRQ